MKLEPAFPIRGIVDIAYLLESVTGSPKLAQLISNFT
jgi:hypothetical protein